MIVEHEHRLLWRVEKGRCLYGHEVTLHTTEEGRCTCGWICWSQYREEILEAHQQHWDFVRRKQREAHQQAQQKEAALHEIRFNELKDAARCSYCEWNLQSSNLAVLLVGFNNHVEKAKDAV